MPKRESFFQKFWIFIILITFLCQSLGVHAQGLVADTTVSSKSPTITQALNGVPLVQITEPNTSGLSHNQYLDFNVNPQGLILNNSNVFTNTQLAGYIDANPNLSIQSASVILNEITSTNPSYLNGYTEVAGVAADVVVANPNGIFVDGAGFINTPRATLTTGTPVFGGSGSLEAFRVTQNMITINGKAFNSNNINRVDLLARAININTQAWAENELNAITGANKIQYDTLEVTPITGEGQTPNVSLDISALGGMYAGKIKLVGTEQGLGFNIGGKIATNADDFILTQDGQIIINGSVQSGGNIDI